MTQDPNIPTNLGALLRRALEKQNAAPQERRAGAVPRSLEASSIRADSPAGAAPSQGPTPRTDALRRRIKSDLTGHDAPPWAQYEELCEDLERENAALREQLSEGRDYIQRMDRVIDEEGVAQSCINPLVDLQNAVRALREQLAEAQGRAKHWESRCEQAWSERDEQIAQRMQADRQLAEARRKAQEAKEEINGSFNAVLNASSWHECKRRIVHDLAPNVRALIDQPADQPKEPT